MPADKPSTPEVPLEKEVVEPVDATVETGASAVENSQPPITQEQAVSQMPSGASAEQPQAVEGSQMANGDDTVVQFTSPSAVQAVDDLIDDETEPDTKKSKWVVLIVVLVLLILALGAGVVYYFTQFSSNQNVELVSPLPDEAEMPVPTVEPDEIEAELEQVNDSDEIEDINTDAENTNLESMGTELEEIEGSL